MNRLDGNARTSTPNHNLPLQTTRFIGREDELAEMSRLLADPNCRLLTLVGPGGIGKTRLAVEVFGHMADDFPDGAYFVSLQPLQSPDQIVQAVVSALDLADAQDSHVHLLAYLREQHLLLVMDNFEHLLDGVDLLTEIMAEAPYVKILATSRESLKLNAEWLREVRGLEYPDDGGTSFDNGYSAVQLFVERAQRLRGDLDFNAQAAHIVRICQLVEGMPLALELAASWVKTLSCREIADELQHNLGILAARASDAPERHRSMQAVFDHSWRLLTEEEQTVLRRMSVFRGGCTREAAEQVTGATLHTLAALVEKSLLRHDPDSGRYDMQELLRQYAEESLVTAAEIDDVRDRHCNYYARTANTLVASRQDIGIENIWAAVEVDFDNIHAGWLWALGRQNYEAVYRMSDAAWEYAISRGVCDKVQPLYQAACDALIDCKGSDERRVLGRMLTNLGKCHFRKLHHAQAEAKFRQAWAIAQENDDELEVTRAIGWLPFVLWPQGKRGEAVELLGQGLALARKRDDPPWQIALQTMRLGNHAGFLGQAGRCRQLIRESMDIGRDIGDKEIYSSALLLSGCWAMRNGEWEQAERQLNESMAIKRALRHRKSVSTLNVCLADLALVTGRFDKVSHYANVVQRDAQKAGSDFLEQRARAAQLFKVLLAEIDGDIGEALRLVTEADPDGNNLDGPGLPVLVKFVRGWVLCSAGEIEAALDALVPFLEDMLIRHAAGELLFAIGLFARILAQQSNHTRAAELLGLIFTHPNSPVGFFENHPAMTRLCADLEAQLGAKAYADAWERGSQLDVEQTARDLLREFGDEPSDPITQANQSLADPLTPRELEVLALLAEGLTNHGIAETLVISRGTVRSHLNHLYSKLAVDNRVQALSQARTLGLL